MRRAVVFPHPDGPTRTMNSPSSIPSSRLVDCGRSVRVHLADAFEFDGGHVPSLGEALSL